MNDNNNNKKCESSIVFYECHIEKKRYVIWLYIVMNENNHHVISMSTGL